MFNFRRIDLKNHRSESFETFFMIWFHISSLRKNYTGSVLWSLNTSKSICRNFFAFFAGRRGRPTWRAWIASVPVQIVKKHCEMENYPRWYFCQDIRGIESDREELQRTRFQCWYDNNTSFRWCLNSIDFETTRTTVRLDGINAEQCEFVSEIWQNDNHQLANRCEWVLKHCQRKGCSSSASTSRLVANKTIQILW